MVLAEQRGSARPNPDREVKLDICGSAACGFGSPSDPDHRGLCQGLRRAPVCPQHHNIAGMSLYNHTSTGPPIIPHNYGNRLSNKKQVQARSLISQTSFAFA